MHDSRVEKLAELLVNYSVGIHKNDRTVINTPNCALPLANAIFTATLRAGGLPIIMPYSEETTFLLYRYGSKEQIEYVHEAQRTIIEQYETRFAILGDENTKVLSRVQPEKIVWYKRARTDLMKTMMRRSATGELLTCPQ